MELEKKEEVIVTVRPIYSGAVTEDSQYSILRDAKSQTQNISTKKAGTGRVGKWPFLKRGFTFKQFKFSKPQTWYRYLVYVLSTLAILALIAGTTYISLVSTLSARLAPPSGHSGLEIIVNAWTEPTLNSTFTFAWPDNFSRDIVPKNCHSHNDYWRRVPLYQALAAGCTSIEADVWLADDGELLVSHSWSSTRRKRTLGNLYLDPLVNILEKRNVSGASTSDKETGVFDTDPGVSAVLLIDVKSDGHRVWPVLREQLQRLRDRNWLTYFDGTTMHRGPLTVVGSGKTPFELVMNETDRFIFYDAPLKSVSDTRYNATNSHYASANLKAAMGGLWLGKFTQTQKETLKQQIKAAAEKGLKSRYWDTPAWPIGMRDSVWSQLIGMGVGVLNVDDLISATRWNWGLCVVAGFVLCGNS